MNLLALLLLHSSRAFSVCVITFQGFWLAFCCTALDGSAVICSSGGEDQGSWSTLKSNRPSIEAVLTFYAAESTVDKLIKVDGGPSMWQALDKSLMVKLHTL